MDLLAEGGGGLARSRPGNFFLSGVTLCGGQ